MVTIKQLTIAIDGKQLLNNVSCTLENGRITSFIGKSGAGKTTLLNAIAGLLPIAKGHILIDNQELSSLTPQQRAHTIGYVFQDFNLFPHYTVLQNCTDPLHVYGMSAAQAEQRALQVLAELSMQEYAHKYPAELSGGQKQRTAIARTLCLQPSVILFDEPTASLDPFNTNSLVTIIRELAKQGLTIGLSSQDTYFIKNIFDRVYYLEDGIIIEYCDGMQNISNSQAINAFMQHS